MIRMQTFVKNTAYTKTEVNGVIAGGGVGGHKDTQMDNSLSLKEDKGNMYGQIFSISDI